MTYSEARAVIATARDVQSGKPLANNTRLHVRYAHTASGKAKLNYAIQLHRTDVLVFTMRGTMILDSGGWTTQTTKERINRFLPKGYRVESASGKWYVTRHTPDNPTVRQVRQRTYRKGEPVTSEYPNWVPDGIGGYRQDGMTEHTYPPRGEPDGWETVTVEDPWVKVADFHDGMEIRISDGTVIPRKLPTPYKAPKRPPARTLTEPVLAWHCIGANHKTGQGGMTVEAGKTYRVKGEPIACHYGLHASLRLADALSYNPGPVVCRVELSGKVDDTYHDKLCATRRKVLWMVNAEELLIAAGTPGQLTQERGEQLEAEVTKLAESQ